MEQKCDRLYPSAPFENKNIDLEQRLEKKMNDVNSFNNHINNNKKRLHISKTKVTNQKGDIKIIKH